MPATRSSRGVKKEEDDEWLPDAVVKEEVKLPAAAPNVEREPHDGSKPAQGLLEGIDLKTKFPVARIKRIMQADEEVGKVAQVTPVVVCKCHLFRCMWLALIISQQKHSSSL